MNESNTDNTTQSHAVSITVAKSGEILLEGAEGEGALCLSPEEAILVGNDLIELGFARIKGDEELPPWVRIPMQQLTMRVKQYAKYERLEPLGEATISCWIRDQSKENASLLAAAHINEFGWEVLECLSQESVTRETFDEDPDNLHYFDQALLEEIVLVFDTIES